MPARQRPSGPTTSAGQGPCQSASEPFFPPQRCKPLLSVVSLSFSLSSFLFLAFFFTLFCLFLFLSFFLFLTFFFTLFFASSPSSSLSALSASFFPSSSCFSTSAAAAFGEGG